MSNVLGQKIEQDKCEKGYYELFVLDFQAKKYTQVRPYFEPCTHQSSKAPSED